MLKVFRIVVWLEIVLVRSQEVVRELRRIYTEKDCLRSRKVLEHATLKLPWWMVLEAARRSRCRFSSKFCVESGRSSGGPIGLKEVRIGDKA
jgi:hypothetical protein